jgi:hypothetical protein
MEGIEATGHHVRCQCERALQIGSARGWLPRKAVRVSCHRSERLVKLPPVWHHAAPWETHEERPPKHQRRLAPGDARQSCRVSCHRAWQLTRLEPVPHAVARRAALVERPSKRPCLPAQIPQGLSLCEQSVVAPSATEEPRSFERQAHALAMIMWGRMLGQTPHNAGRLQNGVRTLLLRLWRVEGTVAPNQPPSASRLVSGLKGGGSRCRIHRFELMAARGLRDAVPTITKGTSDLWMEGDHVGVVITVRQGTWQLAF